MRLVRTFSFLIAVLLIGNSWAADGLESQVSSTASKTLVILGDSISAGYGINSGEGWVELFAAKLVTQGIAVNVVNESISGEVTAGGLSRLPSVLERTKPTWLVIELGGNDGLRGMSPKVMEKNLKAMVNLAKAQGVNVYLFGMKLPPNYGKQYNLLFEKAYKKVASETGIPLLPFFLEGVGGLNELMQADRIHPNQSAQKKLVENAWLFLVDYLRERS